VDEHEQTTLDLVTGHPFTPHPFDPDACAWDEVLFPCGYLLAEHVERLEGAPEGGDA